MTRDRRLRGETQNSRIKGQKGMSSFFLRSRKEACAEEIVCQIRSEAKAPDERITAGKLKQL